MSGAYCLLRGAECTEPTQCLISMAGCAHSADFNRWRYADMEVLRTLRECNGHLAYIKEPEAEEQADDRRNQPITRGEILDAIDATRHTMGDAHDIAMKLLDTLREAFE